MRASQGRATDISQAMPDWFVQFCLDLKQKIDFSLSRILTEPQLGLMKSLIFGGKTNLQRDLQKQIRQVGLAHLVAVSGFHLTVITQIFSYCFNVFLITGFFNFLLSALFIFGFVVMADFSASVIRAGLMACLLLIARLTHRLYCSASALGFAVLFMICLNPVIIRDLGFQLSVLSTLGIIYLYPVFEQWPLWQNPLLRGKLALFKESLLLSLSASMLASAWIIYKIQFFSLMTPLTNLLIIPLVPLIMILGLLVALLGFISFPLAFFIGFWLNLLLSYVLVVITFCSRWPMAEILFPSLGIPLLIIYYLILVYFYYRHR